MLGNRRPRLSEFLGDVRRVRTFRAVDVSPLGGRLENLSLTSGEAVPIDDDRIDRRFLVVLRENLVDAVERSAERVDDLGDRLEFERIERQEQGAALSSHRRTQRSRPFDEFGRTVGGSNRYTRLAATPNAERTIRLDARCSGEGREQADGFASSPVAHPSWVGFSDSALDVPSKWA